MAKKLSTPFANDSSLRNDVPVVASTDQANKGVIGYTKGWTEINKTAIESGGQPPHMEDFNGVLYDVTSNIVDINKGLPQYFDADYATLIGGYPVGSRVVSNDNTTTYISTIASNTNDPNTSNTGWSKISDVEVKDRVSSAKSIAELLTLDKWDGRTVDVESYNEGTNVGGGSFRYDSTQASTNNGVTVFNGWFRDLSNKVLTTDDAGLVSSDDDNSAIFKVITDALDHNFTLWINCKVCVSTQQVIQAKHGIKVHFGKDGLISGKEHRKKFVHWGGAGNRGMLTFIDCMYPQVFDHNVVGAKSINLTFTAEPRAEGDACIHFKRCMHHTVKNGTSSYAYTWGIISEDSSYGLVDNVVVSDVCVQAGISLSLAGGSYNKVTNCTVSNAGLAGIEWESKYVGKLSVGNVSTGNYVYDCNRGQTFVDAMHGVTSSGNRFVRCGYGFLNQGTTGNKDDMQLISIDNDTFVDCTENGTLYYAYGSSVTNNKFYSPVTGKYVLGNPYNVALDFPSLTTFRANVDADYEVNQKIKFAGLDTVYTVTTVKTIPDDTYGMGQLKVVTLDKTIASSVEELTNVRKYNAGKVGLRVFGQNGNLAFKRNDFYNCYQAVISYMNVAPVSDNSEIYTQNSFYNCDELLYIPFGTVTGLRWYANNYTSGIFNIGAGAQQQPRSNNYFPQPKYTTVFNSSRPTEGVGIPKLSFYVESKRVVVGARINFPYADAKTTGTVVVSVDGQNSYVIGAGGLNATVNNVIFYQELNKGVHTIQLPDTVGDLTYKSAIVELMIV